MNKILFNCIVIAILLNIVISNVNPENAVVAINCGGEEFRDSDGILYEKDNYYDGGESSDFGSQFDIKLTQNQDLYQTERWGSSDFTYKIPFTTGPGKYVLILKFSEVYFNSAGEKVFDIALGGETILKGVDIYSKVGKASAYDEYIEFELKNNKVYLKNKVAMNAFNEEKSVLNLTFKKGDNDNPKINAILIMKGTLSDTDYDAYRSQFDEYERAQMEKERKQREFKKITSDIEFEDFEDDFVDTGLTANRGFNFFSFSFISIATIGGYFAYFLFSKINKDKDD